MSTAEELTPGIWLSYATLCQTLVLLTVTSIDRCESRTFGAQILI